MAGQAGLIADIGATNARFAMADAGGIYHEQVLKCGDYPGLVEAAQAYLALINPSSRPRHAAVAIAGPVQGDKFFMTNHRWSFSVSGAQKELGLERFNLMNDFKALALAVPHLKGNDLRQVGGGKAVSQAPIGIVGPGTGLGVASLSWDGARYRAIPGEGGHVTMAARTDREFALFQQLIKMKYHHISAERVCSGKGLVNLYNALRELDGRTDLPDPEPEEISAAGLDGSCSLCVETLQFMVTFLGRVAGNLALTLGAHGGIYIAGGIVGRLGSYFDSSPFREEFVDKGRFRDYLEPIPTFVIQHPFPAFVGLQADLVGSQ